MLIVIKAASFEIFTHWEISTSQVIMLYSKICTRKCESMENVASLTKIFQRRHTRRHMQGLSVTFIVNGVGKLYMVIFAHISKQFLKQKFDIFS